MSSPVAGLAIAFLCVFVMLGMSNPFVVLVTSSIEDAFGVVVPMPTFPFVIIKTPPLSLN